MQTQIFMVHKRHLGLRAPTVLAVGFALTILVGALVLMLPVSAADGQITPFLDALFTAASASCVTGLVTVSTAVHWSVFGKCVILLLIQIGGLGFMSVAAIASFVLRRTITLHERMVMSAGLNLSDGGGIVRLTRRVLFGTFIIEGAGAILLSCRFVPHYGFPKGITMGVFHAVSAFCNAGFDLFGRFGAYSSLVPYVNNYYVQAVIMFMIMAGGLGFMVWVELAEYRKKRRLSLHAKVVLQFSVIFWVGGAVLLALIAWSDSNMAGICFGDSKQQAFTLAGPHVSNVLSFEDPVAPLTVGTVDEFIEYFMARHSEARVDYVHDEPAVRALTRQGGVAFLLPPFEKSDLFKGIVMGGVLPRKTFSMGHAEEKRYYIECRRIKE